MGYRVVTVGREFGCNSGEFARGLARSLGWKLLDRELIDEIARLAHLDPDACGRADERRDGWLHRVGKGLWNAAGEKGPAVVPALPPGGLDADAMAALTRRVIEEAGAAGGCVIVGRGGNYVLRQRPDAFHTFLYAPHAWRVRRLEAQGQSPAAAQALIVRMDHERAAYIRRYFGEEWPRPQFYHLMLNASLGPERAMAAALAGMAMPAATLQAREG